jgi:hypothetical protein
LLAKTLENIEMAVKVHVLLNALGKMIPKDAINEGDWETGGPTIKDSGKIGVRGIMREDPLSTVREIEGEGEGRRSSKINPDAHSKENVRK